MRPEQTEEDLRNNLERLYHQVAGENLEELGFQNDKGLTEIEAQPTGEPVRGPDRIQEETPSPAAGAPFPPPRRGPGLRRILFLLAAQALLLAGAALIWPTLYHVSVVRHADGLYPLRINRVTGAAAFFDGKSWRPPPLAPQQTTPARAERARTPAPPVAAAPAEVPATGDADAPPAPGKPAAAPPPSLADAGRQAPGGRQPNAAPKRPEEAPTSEKALSAPPGRNYAVQIMALDSRFLGERELARLREEALPAFEGSAGQDGWFRVWVGPFASIGAANRYLRERDLARRFPGCFVRRMPEQRGG